MKYASVLLFCRAIETSFINFLIVISALNEIKISFLLQVRSNAVRTLGNLLRLLNAEHLKLPAWQLLYRTAIDKLVQNLNSGNNAKVKWNACYAIGNLMKNELLFTSAKDYDWQKVVFSALINVIINNANFKVRINGAAALAVVARREHYGTHLSTIWSSLLLALEQSNNLVDFNEYKHRDNLQEQVSDSSNSTGPTHSFRIF